MKKLLSILLLLSSTTYPMQKGNPHEKNQNDCSCIYACCPVFGVFCMLSITALATKLDRNFQENNKIQHSATKKIN